MSHHPYHSPNNGLVTPIIGSTPIRCYVTPCVCVYAWSNAALGYIRRPSFALFQHLYLQPALDSIGFLYLLCVPQDHHKLALWEVLLSTWL